ncbi:MAG: GNAT family N-acetyltransferase [Capsulimonadales bacterium]|nr:GNAT family N-acetyltransferase [Capsulimonadales bacterium]
MMIRLCETDADRAKAMAIRFAVFVDEQNVPAELEPDEYDAEAIHLLLEDGDTAFGTARITDRGNGIAKIGRVAILKPFRGKGFGAILMRHILEIARERRFTVAALDAQTYALPFYEKLGFVAEGPEFDDAGIPHRRMTRPL